MTETLKSRRTEISNAEMEVALNRLADELGRVPNTGEWNGWEDRFCYSDRIQERYGSWEDALEAAGIPVVPLRAPDAIRQIAYERPDLTEGFSGVDDK